MSVQPSRRLLQPALGLALSLALGGLFGVSQCALAEDNAALLRQAMAEYKSGNYSDAAGHFAAASSTEYNNPSLHYYMANCYVHLKDRDSAIREFRIAYALEPQSEVGSYSKAALRYYSIDVDGTADAASKFKSGAPAPTAATASSVAAAAGSAASGLSSAASSIIQNQAERDKRTSLQQSQLGAGQVQKLGDDSISRALGGIRNYVPSDAKDREKLIQYLPADYRNVLNKMKSEYDNKQSNVLKAGQEKANKLDESAANLQSLMEDQHSSSVKLQPAGSNLYIRNYEVPAKRPAK